MVNKYGKTILVVDDIAETLDGIEALLKTDGYQIEAARNEQDASVRGIVRLPDLMLVSLDGKLAEVIAVAMRIREKIVPGKNLPIIIFCVGELNEGSEAAAGENVYLAHPNNFNQLRAFISRLLLKFSNAARN